MRADLMVKPLFFLSLAAVVWLAMRHEPLPVPFPHADKLEHFAAFGWLGLISALAWPRRAPAVFLGLLFIAVGTELWQVLLPLRAASVADCVMNVAGGLLGLALGRSGPWWGGEPEPSTGTVD